MKIYVAAPWKEREKASEYAGKIRDLGHTITHEWWRFENVPEGNRNDEFHRICAIVDSYGVRDADVVVLLNSMKSEGKAVEQGIAIALGKKIIAVGKRGEHSKNVFHYMDNYIWVDDFDRALALLTPPEAR